MPAMAVGTIYIITSWNKVEEGSREVPASFSGEKNEKSRGITSNGRIDMSRLEEKYTISTF